jgi:hypothetical protein
MSAQVLLNDLRAGVPATTWRQCLRTLQLLSFQIIYDSDAEEDRCRLIGPDASCTGEIRRDHDGLWRFVPHSA